MKSSVQFSWDSFPGHSNPSPPPSFCPSLGDTPAPCFAHEVTQLQAVSPLGTRVVREGGRPPPGRASWCSGRDVVAEEGATDGKGTGRAGREELGTLLFDPGVSGENVKHSSAVGGAPEVTIDSASSATALSGSWRGPGTWCPVHGSDRPCSR